MITEIEKYKPCTEALVFRKQYSSFKEAWENCPRGDWMLWIAKKSGVDLKVLTKAKALCALTVRHLMKDKRSINACEVALKFAGGLATKEELDAAYTAAYAAYTAAYAAYAAANAAYAAAAAAAYAADAAYAATAAAAAADYAATAAAADYAATAAAKEKNRMKTANICRDILTEAIFKQFGV